MNCKICNAELPNNSIYCGMCGARVDGKKTCTVCKKEIEESYIYCNYCGARVDGKTVCECGNVYEGNFCPVCGKGVAKKKEATVSNGLLVKKIFSTIGGGALAACTLVTLIFVFLIGLKVEMPANLSGLEIPLESANFNIYYFFGKYFREMEGIAETAQYPWFQNLLSADVNLLGIFGIIVCALTLLLVTAFSITALVKYLLNWFGKGNSNFEKWSLASVVSFVVGLAAIYSLNKASASVSGQVTTGVTLNVNVPISLNGATKAAIILISVFVGIFLICRGVSEKWEGLKKRTVLATAFSLVCVALGIVLLCVGGNVAQCIEIAEEGNASISLSMSWLQSNLLWTAAFSSEFVNTMSGYTKATESLMVMNVCNIIAQVCMIAILVLVALTLYTNMSRSEQSVSSIVYSSVALVLSIVVLVLAILSFEQLWFCVNMISNYKGTTEIIKYSSDYTLPIITLVLTAVLTVVSILKAVFVKMNTKTA